MYKYGISWCVNIQYNQFNAAISMNLKYSVNSLAYYNCFIRYILVFKTLMKIKM